MEKAQIVKINPLNIESELHGPVMQSYVDKGWTIATTVILDDPTRPDHDRIRIGLIMLPPRRDVPKPTSRALGYEVLAYAAIVAAISSFVVSLFF